MPSTHELFSLLCFLFVSYGELQIQFGIEEHFIPSTTHEWENHYGSKRHAQHINITGLGEGKKYKLREIGVFFIFTFYFYTASSLWCFFVSLFYMGMGIVSFVDFFSILATYFS